MYELQQSDSPMLFAPCVWVPGRARGVVCDLQRGRAINLPDAYSELMAHLVGRRGDTLAELLVELEEERRPAFLGLLQFLMDQDLLFSTATPERFPPISLRFSHPSLISSAVLDVDNTSNHNLLSLVAELESIGCERLVVRLKMADPLTWLENLWPLLCAGRGMSVEVFMEPAQQTETEVLVSLVRREPRLAVLHKMAADVDEVVFRAPSGFGSIVFHSAPLDLSLCRPPHQDELQVGLELFCESQAYNTFTHRKICISARGTLHNTVGTSPSFGDLHHDSLRQVVAGSDFQAAWFLHKGRIEGCRDCEFRHLCVDPRLPDEVAPGKFVHTSPCFYDPERGRWR